MQALIKATETSNFIRFGGAQRRGLLSDRVSWQPSTNEDACQYIEGCLDLLAGLGNRDDQIGAVARDGLGRHLRSLTANGHIEAVERVVEHTREGGTPWRAGIEGLSEFIRYDSAKAAPSTVDRVKRLVEKLKPKELAHRARYLITDMPWHFPTKEKLDFEVRERRQEEAIRELAWELTQRPDDLLKMLPNLCGGQQRKATLFGICLAELLPDPVEWLEQINRATIETPDGERNFDLLSGYLNGMFGRFPEVVEGFKQTVAESPKLAAALPLICSRLDISAHDARLALDSLQAGRLPPEQLIHWTIGGQLAKLPPEVVSPLFDAMLDHSVDGYAVGFELIGMYVHGDLDRLEQLRSQICKAAASVFRWQGSADGPIAGSHFEETMLWMLGKGRTDPDARNVALTLSKALVEVTSTSSERLLASLVPVLLADFPEISWPLIGTAIVSDELQAWRFNFILGDHGFGVNDRGSPILNLPEETLFAWCTANSDVAPGFVAGIAPILAPADGQNGERLLHPILVRLLDEFGDNTGVLEGVERNLNSFAWVGSVVSYFQTCIEPLQELGNHPKRKVRRWASNALRRVERKIQSASNEDEERAALFES